MRCVVCNTPSHDRRDLEHHLRMKHGILKGEAEIDYEVVCHCGAVHRRPCYTKSEIRRGCPLYGGVYC